MEEFKIKPIGFFNGSRLQKSAVPRQGNLSQQTGFISFQKGFDSKTALRGLEKMSHVWLIFSFHLNLGKPKPLVRPPRNPDIQVGVWATRSPYRPNHLGLTLACVEKIEGAKIYLSDVDLIDGTPILDIKPYVKNSDVAKHPRQGWIDDVATWKYRLSKRAKEKINWLHENGVDEIFDVLESQFCTPPIQPKRKRVKTLKKSDDPNLCRYELAYRLWRFTFRVDNKKKQSFIENVRSAYDYLDQGVNELSLEEKSFHSRFLEAFS